MYDSYFWMKRSGFNYKRKYIFLHESNTSVDSSSFSFILKTRKYQIEDIKDETNRKFVYKVDSSTSQNKENIATFFVSFDKT